MGALATAAIATFLVEALQGYVLGDILHIEFLKKTGKLAGTLSGVIVGFLVALSRKINTQNSALLAVSFAGIGLIPALFGAYLMTFVIRLIEKKITNGLDFIIVVIFCIPLARLLGVGFTPLVDGSLLKIGGIIDAAMAASPLLMGLILGGIISVVGTSPLSSMALTAMLGLTGAPMAVAALTAFASSFMNTTLLHRLKIGNLKSVISIAIEPLSKADLVSSNPVPIYVTNFIGGGLAGMVIAYSGLINDAPGTAAPTPGIFGYVWIQPCIRSVEICCDCCNNLLYCRYRNVLFI